MALRPVTIVSGFVHRTKLFLHQLGIFQNNDQMNLVMGLPVEDLQSADMSEV